MMPGWQSPKLLLLVWFLLTVALTVPLPAFAWGDEGHKVIALIAEQYLDPAVRFQGRHTSRCRHCHFDRTRHRQRGDMGRQVSGQRSQRDQDPVRSDMAVALCGCRTGAAGPCRDLFRPSCAPARDSGIEGPAASLRG